MIKLVTTKISREKLYRKEYQRNSLLSGNGIISEDTITKSLAKILILMIAEKGKR